MDFRVASMMFYSALLSLVGMCIGSVLAGGHAIILLQILFPFVLFFNSIMKFFGLIGIAVTIATSFVFILGENNRTKLIMAIVCVLSWSWIVYPLDKGYMK